MDLSPVALIGGDSQVVTASVYERAPPVVGAMDKKRQEPASRDGSIIARDAGQCNVNPIHVNGYSCRPPTLSCYSGGGHLDIQRRGGTK